jgi:hypothetical protein
VGSRYANDRSLQRRRQPALFMAPPPKRWMWPAELDHAKSWGFLAELASQMACCLGKIMLRFGADFPATFSGRRDAWRKTNR